MHKWEDIAHKGISPERRELIRREAIAELDRQGATALREAQSRAGLDTAAHFGIQPEELALHVEKYLVLLAKNLRAAGGDFEMRAIFTEADFNLEPLPILEVDARL